MAKAEDVVAKGIAAGRVLFGVACMAAPRKVVGPAGGRAEGPMVSIVRTFGVRDVVLGAGTFLAVGEGRDGGRLWVELSALADSLDIANALVFRKDLDRQGLAGILALAVPASAGGWWSARRLRTR